MKFKTDEHFMKYQKMIAKWSHIYVNNDLGDFDDMYQEVSMVYLRACDSYQKNKSKFSTYLHKSIRNNMIDLLRKRNKEPMILSLDKKIGVNNGGEELTHLDVLVSNDVHFEGEIMEMLYKGMNITEIAEYLGINRSTVYRRLEKERDEHL